MDTPPAQRLVGPAVAVIALLAALALRVSVHEASHLADASDPAPTATSAGPTATPPANARQPGPTVDLASLRRWFHAAPASRGMPVPGRPPIVLEGHIIHTGGNRLTLSESEPATRSPYFVQFTGPVEPAWRTEATRIGGIPRGYLPHHTLIVELDHASAKRLARRSFVAWIHPVMPEHKVQPFLAHLSGLEDPGLPETLPVTISTFGPRDTESVREELVVLGIPVLEQAAGRRWGWLRAEVPRRRVTEVAALDRVQWIEEYVEPAMANDRAVMPALMNVTPSWQTYGLTGRGQIIGHADTGLDLGSTNLLHPDLRTNLLVAFDRGRPGRWDDPHGHGTHTAGSIIGDGTMSTGTFRGVAWEARLVHQSILDGGGGLGGLPTDLNELYSQTYTNGARIHSDSWGSSVFGSYTTSSRQSDEFMWDHPDMLLVFAAGNDGYDGNADGIVDRDSLGAPATAKNLLTIGAAESGRPPGSGGYSGYTYGDLWYFDYLADPIHNDYISTPFDGTNQGLAAFSSRGPTDDGRIKPDLVAPGTDIVSTRSRAVGAGSGWGIHPNNNYNFNGGTSMATPLAAGAAALVRQYFGEFRYHAHPSAALVKAALIHGARPMAPGQYGTNVFFEVAGTPDHAAGWGHVDIGNTLFPQDTAWFHADTTNGPATPGTHTDHVFYAGTGMVRATLAYTDYPATAGSGLKLVNDLDLVLTGPGGILVHREGGPDRTNNIEQIRFDVTAPGVYTARVEAVNVPSGPQPYALVVSGPVIDQPGIRHTPLPNTHITNLPYRLEAEIASAAPVATNAVSIYWRLAGMGPVFNRVQMRPVTNHVFEGWIPAQPRDSVIEYYLGVTSAVFTATHPIDAPATVHTFEVSAPLTLSVSGAPADIFSVTPGYGLHTFASGNVVRLSAPAFTNTSPGIRIAIAGWTGGGNVPATGDSNELAVVLTESSFIIWEWVTQHALVQTANVAGIVNTTSWWNAWASAQTETAPMETTVGGINYGLTGWYIDGVRHPGPSAAAQNPSMGVIMYSPRAAVARYLPSAQDVNANGLPDWWEQFHFGTNGATANLDADDDGFTNIKEFQDRTDPREESDYPQAPSIAHLPLANPQPLPAPWSVTAVIVDNHAVSNAVVAWQRDGGAWTSALLKAGASNLYQGILTGPAANGDTITYRIEATDHAGLKAVSGPFTLGVAYPVMTVTPATLGVIDVPDAAVSNVTITISNAGLAELHWTADLALFHDAIEAGTGTWRHVGMNDLWHIQTARHASVRHAWHFGTGPGGLYGDNAHAWLESEPVTLHGPARLTFRHWAKMEYDMDQGDDHYWDGAVVEISTNLGATYEMMTPEGGYPHRITDNPASPFPPDTPCYGETAGWEDAAFDLSAYEGHSIRIRFRFGSDGYVREEGWYIDDVNITYPDPADWSWINLASAGSVMPGGTTNVTVTLDTTGIDLGERRQAVVVLSGDAPEQPAPFVVSVGLHNATRAIAITRTAHGTVTPEGVAYVLYGEDLPVILHPDPYFEVGMIFTNGILATGPAIAPTNFTWAGVESNGTLHIVFTEKLAGGGAPEWWLAAQGLTNQPPDIEAGTDHDGDGMLTWQEYLAGTEPTNAASVEMIVYRVNPEPGGDVVQWLSFTNTALRYDLHITTNPVDGFTPVATGLTANPPMQSFTNTYPETPYRAYRVIATPGDTP